MSLISVFLFSVVNEMSEINFPCPVPVSSIIQTSQAECDDGNKAVQCYMDQSHPLRSKHSTGLWLPWGNRNSLQLQDIEQGRKIYLNISLLVPSPILALACFNWSGARVWRMGGSVFCNFQFAQLHFPHHFKHSRGTYFPSKLFCECVKVR